MMRELTEEEYQKSRTRTFSEQLGNYDGALVAEVENQFNLGCDSNMYLTLNNYCISWNDKEKCLSELAQVLRKYQL